MNRWKSIEQEIADFRRLLCSDAKPFAIQAAYDYDWEPAAYKEACKDRRYQRCGVYLVFSKAEELIYVGVAMYTFEKRIWRHPNLADLDAKFIDIIPFDDRFKPLALALEWFLIARLKPKGNRIAVGYDVPIDAAGTGDVVQL